jgi:hypothetical protein
MKSRRQTALPYYHLICVRGCLHVYESVYKCPYDSMYDLRTKQIGIRLFIRTQLQPSVYTFQEKSIPNSFAKSLLHQMVHGIVGRFARKIARVDGPQPSNVVPCTMPSMHNSGGKDKANVSGNPGTIGNSLHLCLSAVLFDTTSSSCFLASINYAFVCLYSSAGAPGLKRKREY